MTEIDFQAASVALFQSKAQAIWFRTSFLKMNFFFTPTEEDNADCARLRQAAADRDSLRQKETQRNRLRQRRDKLECSANEGGGLR